APRFAFQASASPETATLPLHDALPIFEFEHGVVGIAFNLEEDNVGVALFGEWQHVKEGEPVRRTGAVMSVPVGDALLGRVVDPLDRKSTCLNSSHDQISYAVFCLKKKT